MDASLDAGADDIDLEDDGSISVFTPWETLGNVVAALRHADLTSEHAEVAMVAATSVRCDDEQAETVLNLIDALEELDDVQNVYSNGDYPDSAFDD
jgi:transcriptional/translational regulatory protein YebC/TACO1